MEERNIYKQLRESTETDTNPALTQGELAAIFAKEGNPLSQSVISKLENQQKEPPTKSPDVIKAYATHFKVTADYLLGIRKTKSLDENIAMISKTTGLDEDAIKTLQFLNKRNEYINTLNFIMRDCDLICDFLSNLHLYMNNEYTTPLYYDNTTRQYIDCSYHTPNGDGITFGKQIADNKGKSGWATIGVPTSILESHALRCIQQLLDDWRKEYKKGSD